MLKALPDHADPYRLCEQAVVFAGDVKLTDMSRLLPLLAAGEGCAEYQISFGRDDEGRYCINGQVRAVFVLTCQRCLHAMELSVDISFCLSPVNGVQEAEQLPDEYDPWLIEEPSICPLDIIEDELILAVPTAPRHKETNCKVDLAVLNQPANDLARETVEPKESPFAVLASLKSKDLEN